jgi:signal transduction histidine kinase
VSRFDALIHNLFDITRMIGGRSFIEPSPIDLSELVEAVVEHAQVEAAGRRIELRLHIEHRVRGTWDRMRIEQVLTNLLGHAMKYGKGEPVEITVSEGEHNVKVAVRDFGDGISPEHQARIFDRFVRLTTPQDATGLGLGLWIAREIARAHGGDVTVHSTPGAGSTFALELPRQG